MEESLQINSSLENAIVLQEIKENIQLVKINGKKYIIKGKRDDELNLFEKLRFANEKRIYKTLNNSQLIALKFPSYHIDEQRGHLILEFLKNSEKPVQPSDYINAYFELQRIKPKSQFFLDYYNQLVRGFFYRVFVVSLLTVWKRSSALLSFQILLTYLKLEISQRSYSRKFWMHGDLTTRNYFYNEDNEVYFIDFENMFYTRKWFLAEIVGKAFAFDIKTGSLSFSSDSMNEYIRMLQKGQSIKNYDLNKQVRFGILQHAVLQIVQTKIPKKRRCYIDMIKIIQNDDLFQEWLKTNIEN